MNSEHEPSYYDIENKKEDFLSSILNKWKERKIGAKNLFKKSPAENIEAEDALSALTTLDEKTKALRKKTIVRFVSVMLFLSVGMFIITGAVKVVKVLNTEERKDVPTKVQDVKLEINSFTKWQEIKDQEVVQLSGDIKNVEISLDKKITNVQSALSQELNTTSQAIKENMHELQQTTQGLLNTTLSEIKNEIKQVNQDTKNYTDLHNLSIQEKIAQVESKAKELIKKQGEEKIDINKLALPPLNQLSDSTKVGKNEAFPPKNNEAVKPKVQMVEEEIGTSLVVDVSTLKEEANATKEGIPAFTLMPGFSKGMLVTGADVPTLAQGTDVSRAVWISTTGEVLIANNHTANIQECLIQGAATGNFASGIAEIRLSQITCSAINENGKYYKISSSVKGWVYGENGKYGLKGRLVSKEGEIIKKAIPLTILEGAIGALENSTKGNSYSYGGYSAGAAGGGITDSFAQGATKTASNTLDKFSDYYLKILEQLNPVIEIKAGREVTIAFAGGESFKFEEYTPADVDFFESKGVIND